MSAMVHRSGDQGRTMGPASSHASCSGVRTSCSAHLFFSCRPHKHAAPSCTVYIAECRSTGSAVSFRAEPTLSSAAHTATLAWELSWLLMRTQHGLWHRHSSSATNFGWFRFKHDGGDWAFLPFAQACAVMRLVIGGLHPCMKWL